MKRNRLIAAAMLLALAACPAIAVDEYAGTRLEPFVQAAAQIRMMEDGRASAVFWDLAGLTDAQIQEWASCGFNELVVDGHHYAARRINQMAYRILELKKELRRRQELAADQIVKGVLINVEVYADRSWNYDFTEYVNLHRELESLVLRSGLTYESFEAFWIGETRHESGRAMTGFQINSPRTVYIMSYRKDGYEAFKIANYFAVQGSHLAGFDLVTKAPVGFRDAPSAMAEAVSDYVELADSPVRFQGSFRQRRACARRLQHPGGLQ